MILAGGEQAVVQLGEDIDALFPEDFGGEGAGVKVVEAVADVAAGFAHLAGGEDIGQAGSRIVAEDVNDVVEHFGVVAEDGHHRAGDDVEGAFVGGTGDVELGGGRAPEDVPEVVLDGDRVLLGPAGPGAAEDAGAAAVANGVVAEVEAGFVAAKSLMHGGPGDEDVAGLLGIGLVAGEIPHSGEVIDGDHVAPPRPEVFVGVAFHHLEGAAHAVGELGAAVGRERGVAGFPRLLVEVGLDRIKLRKGVRYARVGEGAGGNDHGTEEDRDDREQDKISHFERTDGCFPEEDSSNLQRVACGWHSAADATGRVGDVVGRWRAGRYGKKVTNTFVFSSWTPVGTRSETGFPVSLGFAGFRPRSLLSRVWSRRAKRGECSLGVPHDGATRTRSRRGRRQDTYIHFINTNAWREALCAGL